MCKRLVAIEVTTVTLVDVIEIGFLLNPAHTDDPPPHTPFILTHIHTLKPRNGSYKI